MSDQPEFHSGTTEGPDFDVWWKQFGHTVSTLGPHEIAMAAWNTARHLFHQPLPAPEPPALPDIRELIVRADSYLSLLWHRHVRREARGDVDLQINVNRTIGDLRQAVERLKPASEVTHV